VFTWPNWVKSSPSTLPVGGIDWCDAWAYCAFRGKRLCGKVGGGALELAGKSSMQVNQEGEFSRACSANNTKVYPYGASHQQGACRDSKSKEEELKEPAPVGSMPACEGGYPGLFDMSGNVQEWINACDAENADPAKTACHVAGGSWNYLGNATFCAFSQANPREVQAAQNGVRCCWDPE
jgi:formylglycine-generating enzyme required for sulfatase activity